VVIGYCHIGGASVLPLEANSILIIDPDAELAFSISFESFESVAWKSGKISERIRGMNASQLDPRLVVKVRRERSPRHLCRSAIINLTSSVP